VSAVGLAIKQQKGRHQIWCCPFDFLVFVIFGTLGLAAIVLVPLQMLVGWAVAALQLQVFVHLFSRTLYCEQLGLGISGGLFRLRHQPTNAIAFIVG